MGKQAFEIPKMKVVPELDPDFIPAEKASSAFETAVKASGRSAPLAIALERGPISVSVFKTAVFANPSEEEFKASLRYVERLLKGMLWMKGGRKVTIAGDARICAELAKIYSNNGARAFDAKIMARIYSGPMEFISKPFDENAPHEIASAQPLGRHLEGCRIGFDLGGSDRKVAAMIDGKVVFSEEIPWDPYFQKDPSWHKAGINDSLRSAAAKLPRVDAIGGSAAGVYVENRVRIASLFRGVPEEQFESSVRDLFLDLGREWGVPFVVVNDGEVTALAGSMEMNANCVLGISMGTSMAGGCVDAEGRITDWLNELAFAPIDYRSDAPADEWSGDLGCGVQYFSQQGAARLAAKAGIELPADMPLAKRLIEIQELLKAGDKRAIKVFETIGVCFGYSVAWYARFYEIEKLLILGRVTSGAGGDIVIAKAKEVLQAEYPQLAKFIEFRIPDEQGRRHGQAIAAASLPSIK